MVGPSPAAAAAPQSGAYNGGPACQTRPQGLDGPLSLGQPSDGTPLTEGRLGGGGTPPALRPKTIRTIWTRGRAADFGAPRPVPPPPGLLGAGPATADCARAPRRGPGPPGGVRPSLRGRGRSVMVAGRFGCWFPAAAAAAGRVLSISPVSVPGRVPGGGPVGSSSAPRPGQSPAGGRGRRWGGECARARLSACVPEGPVYVCRGVRARGSVCLCWKVSVCLPACCLGVHCVYVSVWF